MNKINPLNQVLVSPYAEKIMLRFLIEKNNFDLALDSDGDWRNRKIASALGIPKEYISNEYSVPFNTDKNEKTHKLSLIKNMLSERYDLIKDKENNDSEWKTINDNLEILSKILELNQVEKEILRLSLHIEVEEELKDCLDYLKAKNINRLAHNLSSLLNVSFNDVKLAIRAKGKLFGYGLLKRSYSLETITDYICFDDLINASDFFSYPFDPVHLLQKCVKKPESGTLSFKHFEYIAETRDFILQYLQQCKKLQKKGVHILIYGKPGAGKTEFAQLLAKSCFEQVYNLTYEDEDEETIKPIRRLELCRITQKLIKDKNTLVIFDEIEDIFSANIFERSPAQQNKAWLNNFLETSDIPMIWLSNSVNNIDKAYLRRFDIIFEMPDLPISNKAALIKDLVGENLSENYIQHFAQQNNLSAALLTKGLSVTAQLIEKNDPQAFAECALKWFNQSLQAQGYKKIEKLDNYQLDYNLDWVNCNEDIQAISTGLMRHKRGRICCFGAPGTGKTQWARWLANQLEMPLLVKRGSDLLGMYVGETEKNIANAFSQAKQNNMLLMLDEVDSFLFGRETAQRNWETSMVNEMLVQIERFDGLLIVSTNLLENLDSAVLRRFDLKLNFDYLTMEQICSLAQQQAKILGLTLEEIDFMRLQKIKSLALGDFAAVARRHRFAPFSSAEKWIQALEDECNFKKTASSKPIGFF